MSLKKFLKEMEKFPPDWDSGHVEKLIRIVRETTAELAVISRGDFCNHGENCRESVRFKSTDCLKRCDAISEE
jgi:hypothetical protein